VQRVGCTTGKCNSYEVGKSPGVASDAMRRLCDAAMRRRCDGDATAMRRRCDCTDGDTTAHWRRTETGAETGAEYADISCKNTAG